MGNFLNRELIRIIKKQNAKISKLQKRMSLDFGTGVLNKEQGFIRLKKEMKICKKKKAPMSIAFVDVDSLKKINDNYGHCEGDRALNIIATIMGRNIRKDDFVFRFGGDEFIVVFRNSNIEEAKEIWDRVVDRINEVNFKRKLPYMISVSAGFAGYKENTSIRDLIEYADKNMYKNKMFKYYKYA